LYAQAAASSADAQFAIAQSSDEIKRFSRRLLERQSQRVLLDRIFDRIANLWRCAKEAIGGHESLKRLMRALKIVALYEEVDATEAVRKISEDRSCEELIPQRFPKALHFAERLRMLGSALNMSNAVLAESLLKLGLSSPSCILTPLVSEDFDRRTEVCNSTLNRLEDER
jgi:hypothetical protein